jgi:hypothetical protein
MGEGISQLQPVGMISAWSLSSQDILPFLTLRKGVELPTIFDV